MKHLIDYVWMALPGEEPVQVSSKQEELTKYMARGYSQVWPENNETQEDGE
jgi:hypothetical protein